MIEKKSVSPVFSKVYFDVVAPSLPSLSRAAAETDTELDSTLLSWSPLSKRTEFKVLGNATCGIASWSESIMGNIEDIAMETK